MSVFGDRLKELRLEKGLTQSELAKDLHIDRTALTNYESGKRYPRPATRDNILDYFNVDGDYMDGKQDEKRKFDFTGVYESGIREGLRQAMNSGIKNIVPFEVKEIPILGKIACGEPIFADEERGRYTLVSGVNADFALEAQGDSMIGDRIYNGDVVFCRNQPQVNNGEIAVVIIRDEATLKHFFYYPDRGMVILKASNPAYEDLIYMDDEMADIRILGKAVAVEFGI